MFSRLGVFHAFSTKEISSWTMGLLEAEAVISRGTSVYTVRLCVFLHCFLSHIPLSFCWSVTPHEAPVKYNFFFFSRLFIYLLIRESISRGGGKEWSRLPTEQGARCGTRSQDPEIMTWATQAPPGYGYFKKKSYLWILHLVKMN